MRKNTTTRTIPLLTEISPRARYGLPSDISFDVFGRTAIPEEKLFTSDFAKNAYTSIYRASTEENNRNAFALFPKECVWIKTEMERLDIAADAAIKIFLGDFEGVVQHIEKNISADKTSLSRHQFCTTIKALFADVKFFISIRRPDLDLSDVMSSYPGEIVQTQSSSTMQMPAAMASEDFSVSTLPKNSEQLIFSAAFAKYIYEKLIQMSQEHNQCFMYEGEICKKIKDSIESAKTLEALTNLIIYIIDTSSKQTSKTDAFKKTLLEIANNINRYSSIAYPSFQTQLLDILSDEKTRCDNEITEWRKVSCCFTLCVLNAGVQLPLNIIWPFFWIMGGGCCMPYYFEKAACLGAFFPFESVAIQEKDFNYCTPIALSSSLWKRCCALNDSIVNHQSSIDLQEKTLKIMMSPTMQ